MAILRRGRGFSPVYDPALDDPALPDVREDVLMGRWDSARDLIAATGQNWDRRTHRMRVLADVAAGYRWVETWLEVEPDNRDAHVLHAVTEVMRVFRAHTIDPSATSAEDLEEARRSCLVATEWYPQDPVPWVALLSLARLYDNGQPEIWKWWWELTTRDRFNRDAHHQVLQYLFPRWHGSFTEMFDFAADTAAQAPPGSPLHLLPLVAHTEDFRVRKVDPDITKQAGLTFHWTSPEANQLIDRAMARWLDPGPLPHAQAMLDLNYLIYALVNANRLVEAAPLFRAVGQHATKIPWAYTRESEWAYTRGAEEEFLRCRTHALRAESQITT